MKGTCAKRVLQTSPCQAKDITNGQASYSADPCVDSACARERAGEGHLRQKSFVKPGITGTATKGLRHREIGPVESTVREGKNVDDRQGSKSTGSRQKSACTRRQTDGSDYHQRAADTGGLAKGVLP